MLGRMQTTLKYFHIYSMSLELLYLPYVELHRKDSMQRFKAYIHLRFYQNLSFETLVVMFFVWKRSKNVILDRV